MDTSISLSALTASITKFFSKYHATIFFTLIALLLAGAILNLYLAVQNPPTPETQTEVISGTFDQTTANKIKDLRSSSESQRDLVYPSPRNSPFVE